MSGAIMNKIWGAFGMDANEEEEEEYEDNTEEIEEESNKENKIWGRRNEGSGAGMYNIGDTDKGWSDIGSREDRQANCRIFCQQDLRCGGVSSYPCPSYPSFCVARGVHKDLIS